MDGPTNPAEEHFNKGLWGHDGSVWRKLALLWGYSDRWAEDLGGTKSGAGNYAAQSAAVPSGWVYKLELAFIRNITGARGRQIVQMYDGAVLYSVKTVLAPAVNDPLTLIGSFTLKEGDYIRVVANTCLDADVLQAGCWGYMMEVA